MEITVDELLKGKPTKIKGKEYYSAEQYVTPFLDRLSKYTDDFRIQAILPNQISLTREGDINFDDIVYNRLWIQAVLPDELNFPNHFDSISLLYALDARKPMAKIARTAINGACLNQCVFNPSFLNVQEIEPETPFDFKPIDVLMSLTSDIGEKLKKMQSIEIPYTNDYLNSMLGSWCRNCFDKNKNTYSGVNKVKLAVSTALDAYKLLYLNEESSYYVKPEQSTSLFNIYNAWTDLISHNEKDIFNPIEKTYLVQKILDFA